MKFAQLIALLLACGSVLLTGCTSQQEILGLKDQGDARMYEIERDHAWETAKQTLSAAGFAEVLEHPEQFALSAQAPRTNLASASVAAAWVKQREGGKVQVTFLSRRKNSLQMRGAISAVELHTRFSGLLALSPEDLEEAGQPAAPPAEADPPPEDGDEQPEG